VISVRAGRRLGGRLRQRFVTGPKGLFVLAPSLCGQADRGVPAGCCSVVPGCRSPRRSRARRGWARRPAALHQCRCRRPARWRPRVGAWLIGAALTTWCAPALAGTIRGYVLDGQTGQPQPGVPVVLQAWEQPADALALARAQSDAQGRFTLTSPQVRAGFPFRLVASYCGVAQSSARLQAGEQDLVIVEVYPPTDDPSDIRVAAHAVFLNAESGRVDVAHLLYVDNGADAVYTGARAGDGGGVTPLWLPAAAFGLEQHAADFTAARGDTVFDGRPLLPGRTQVAYSFSLDQASVGGRIEQRVLLPTDQLDIFIHPAAIALPEGFVDLGQAEIDGLAYHQGRRTDVRSGEGFVVPLASEADPGAFVRWGALFVALGVAGVTLWSSRRVVPQHEPVGRRGAQAEPQEPRR